MNNVVLIGRLTRDPDVRVTENKLFIAKFSLAIDRPTKDGGTDFPNVICFGKTAEIVDAYVKKGKQVAVIGRLQTGSYENKEGKKVYTTDVLAERIELLGGAPKEEPRAKEEPEPVNEYAAGFEALEDEVPF